MVVQASWTKNFSALRMSSNGSMVRLSISAKDADEIHPTTGKEL
jgi:hypothetical protein